MKMSRVKSTCAMRIAKITNNFLLRGYRLMKWAAAVVYVVPFIPAKHRAFRRLAAVFLSLSQVFVVGMHIYMMDNYWYDKTVNSKGGLLMELLLYISAAITVPVMQYYLDCWSSVSTENGFQILPPHVVKNSPILETNATKGWLRRISADKSLVLPANGNGNGLLAACSRYENHASADVEKGVALALAGNPTDNSDDHVNDVNKGRVSPFLRSTVLAFLVGYALVFAYVLFDLIDERVFDEKDIRKFMRLYHLSSMELFCYWTYVILVFWGMFSSVMTCCIFHALCAEQRGAIDTVVSDLLDCADRETARTRINELAEFLRQRRAVMGAWFITHTALFAGLLLSMFHFNESPWQNSQTHYSPKFGHTEASNAGGVVTELENASVTMAITTGPLGHWWSRGYSTMTTDAILTGMSKAVSVLILVFKFSYPFFQATSVTHHWTYVTSELNLKCLKLSLPDKNAVIEHWKNSTSGYIIGHVMLTGTSRVVPFAMSALLIVLQAH